MQEHKQNLNNMHQGQFSPALVLVLVLVFVLVFVFVFVFVFIFVLVFVLVLSHGNWAKAI